MKELNWTEELVIKYSVLENVLNFIGVHATTWFSGDLKSLLIELNNRRYTQRISDGHTTIVAKNDGNYELVTLITQEQLDIVCPPKAPHYINHKLINKYIDYL